MKLTRSEAIAFGKFMREWQEKLNLMDWRVAKIRGNADAMCEVHITHEDRLAAWRLGDWADAPRGQRELSEIACHEMLHVLLSELSALAMSEQQVTMEQVDAAEHRIIQTIINLLVPTA